mgnify:FL=1|tara:strand:- start:417 stop:872 length:456 start_codon:yes stop_codon:yes gene_type:complete
MCKKIILSFLLILLGSCASYESIYKGSGKSFLIGSIELGNKNLISYKIKNNLNRYISEKKNVENSYKIEFLADRKILITSKDGRGNAKTFELSVTVDLTAIRNDIQYKKTFIESFSYQNNSNKFNLRSYEKNITTNMINKLTSEIVNYLAS